MMQDGMMGGMMRGMGGMDGMGGMMAFMGGGMLLVVLVLVAIGFALGYAVARRR